MVGSSGVAGLGLGCTDRVGDYGDESDQSHRAVWKVLVNAEEAAFVRDCNLEFVVRIYLSFEKHGPAWDF